MSEQKIQTDSGPAVRPVRENERPYCYTQSPQLRSQTGCIGYLRAYMDTAESGFYSSWNGFRDSLNTDEFRGDLERVLGKLRDGTEDAFLSNRMALGRYCWAHMSAALNDRNDFAFRVDTERYVYMMRVTPERGEYNLYCYCYDRESLDCHLKEAERGIRFIDTGYRDLFKVPDGGKIVITYSDGERCERVCRFIDSTHFEMGTGALSIYHICEFAERMEASGAKVEPYREPERAKRGGYER